MRVLLDWSQKQHCVDCNDEMRKPKSEYDSRPPHYGFGKCQKCYYLTRSDQQTRRYDWSKPRYCATCKKQMRPNGAKSDGSTVKHASNGICINCKDTVKRAQAGAKTRVALVHDENGQVCKYCDRHLPFEKFPTANHNPTGRRSKCYWCQSIWDAYRLTFQQFSVMLQGQGGLCGGCSKPPASGSFVVDHDHSCCPGEKTCGRCVRGLLCSKCNLALGHVSDSVERLEGLISYLKERQGN